MTHKTDTADGEARLITVGGRQYVATTTAATILGISERTLYRWMKKGVGLHPIRLAGHLLFALEDLSQFPTGKR